VSDWDGFAVTPSDVLDAGDTAVARGHYSGKCKENGRDVRAQFAHIFSFRDGKIVKFQQCTDTAQFARAVAE